MRTTVPEKLLAIADDIAAAGSVSLTRLTVLKNSTPGGRWSWRSTGCSTTTRRSAGRTTGIWPRCWPSRRSRRTCRGRSRSRPGLIRDRGNQAVHSKRLIHQLDVIRATGELFHILYWFARTYSKAWKHEGLAFDPNLLSKAAPGAAAAAQQQASQTQATAAQVQKLAETDAQIAALTALANEDYAETAPELAGLPTTLDSEDEGAKRFDLLVLKLQLALLNADRTFEGCGTRCARSPGLWRRSGRSRWSRPRCN